MQLALDVRHGYENVDALCPHCRSWQTYNKATDLRGNPAHIAGEVICKTLSCAQPFRLIGNCNHPFEQLLWDAHRLLDHQYHTAAVLLAAQAFEVFAALYARQTLLYIPAGTPPSRRLREISPVARQLRTGIDKLSFQKMVNLLLNLVVLVPRPSTLEDSSRIIANLAVLTAAPSDALLGSVSDSRLAELLGRVKQTRIGTLRNRSVHKDAYRPSATQAAEAVAEAGDLLFPLSVHLGLYAATDHFGPTV